MNNKDTNVLESQKSLAERDKAHIWHPYTQMKTAALPIPIKKAKGTMLYAENGKEYIDAVSSWWLNIHGHAHPYIAKKVYEQMLELEHVIFAGFTHEPAITLAERLLKILPSKQEKFFFSDNGSTAVEVGLKMAMQYWYNKDIKRTKVIAFRNAYHGDTFGAMAVSGRSVFTAPFNPFLFDVVFIDAPIPTKVEASKKQLAEILQHDDVACFIFEPLIQGAGGMQMHAPKHLDELIAMCQAKDVLCIADEVMTGFGRTGKYFASLHLQNQPDIMCLSKGLTAGYLPLALTTCTQNVYNAFLSESPLKTFFHGHSFTANTTACAAALASLDLLQSDECQGKIKWLNEQHQAFQQKIKAHKNVDNSRLCGTVLAIELQTSETTSYLNNMRYFIANFALENGVLLRPLGNVIYILSPFCITEKELNKVYDVIVKLLNIL
ncbi:MAG: adenosylmethionine--8-amino-7-oxononanoate transaminase [Chitinophagales bacterium]